MDKIKKILLLALLVISPLTVVSAQPKDSLVRLISAQKAKLADVIVGEDTNSMRIVTGDAIFFHNNSNLFCDSALWNVNGDYLDAVGNVRIEQNNTTLTGDSLHYITRMNLAEFRGSLVELIDDQNNILRTHYLDYNTKDSIAVFFNGGSMKDEDGNIIESDRGRYDSKSGLFEFVGNVEMFSDSLFFKTDKLVYNTDEEVAYFYGKTRAWKDVSYIRSQDGWYNTTTEDVSFIKDVYMQDEEYEAWCEKVIYKRDSNIVEMYDNVQVLDTAGKTIVAGGELHYRQNPRRISISDNPVLVSYGEGVDDRDTIFVVADRFIYEGHRKCDIDSAVVADALTRKELSQVDPFKEIRDKQRALREQIERRKNPPKKDTIVETDTLSTSTPKTLEDSIKVADIHTPKTLEDSILVRNTDGLELKDSIAEPRTFEDSFLVAELPDSLHIGEQLTGTTPVDTMPSDSTSTSLPLTDSTMVGGLADSLAVVDSLKVVPLDTTMIAFVTAHKNVRLYKNDIKLQCDSLAYSDLDSLVRLFQKPILWHEESNQMTSDSMQFVIKERTLEKGILLSNAYTVIDQGGLYYNQIKAPEMMGYFTDGVMTRMDAVGGVTALMFLAEAEEISTLNSKKSKLMTATIQDGSLRRTLYVEGIESDAFPVYELDSTDIYLKDFAWHGDLKPKSRYDLTELEFNSSQRKEYEDLAEFPIFKYTELYFEDYMENVLRMINSRKPLKWKTRNK